MTILAPWAYEPTGVTGSVELYIPMPWYQNRLDGTTIELPLVALWPSTPPIRNPVVIILR
jgi:predicted membrane-bound mannosyltransferase